MIGAVEGSTGKKSRSDRREAFGYHDTSRRSDNGLSPEACLLVGDRLETDILMGKKAGMATALVLTGVTKERP